jgi:hypothetical protein
MKNKLKETRITKTKLNIITLWKNNQPEWNYYNSLKRQIILDQFFNSLSKFTFNRFFAKMLIKKNQDRSAKKKRIQNFLKGLLYFLKILQKRQNIQFYENFVKNLKKKYNNLINKCSLFFLFLKKKDIRKKRILLKFQFRQYFSLAPRFFLNFFFLKNIPIKLINNYTIHCVFSILNQKNIVLMQFFNKFFWKDNTKLKIRQNKLKYLLLFKLQHYLQTYFFQKYDINLKLYFHNFVNIIKKQEILTKIQIAAYSFLKNLRYVISFTKLLPYTINIISGAIYFNSVNTISRYLAYLLNKLGKSIKNSHLRLLKEFKAYYKLLSSFSWGLRGLKIAIFGKLSGSYITRNYKTKLGLPFKKEILINNLQQSYSSAYTYTGVFGLYIWSA